MRLALIVGIDSYKHCCPLFGCVKDANSLNDLLVRHYNGNVNFECQLLIGDKNKNSDVNRSDLKDQIKKLFESDAEIVLFYFSGHGYVESTGGYILATDSERGDDGVSLSEVVNLANQSPARNKIIILDSCHSGITGTTNINHKISGLSEGLTILTASTKDQYAIEENGGGIFTNLLIDALDGGASNLIGDVTPGGIYAHVDQSLGGWEQRPVFKTNVKEFVSLRKVLPSISISDLQKITGFFPSSSFEFPLDPTYEPELKGREPNMPAPISKHTEDFAILQKYNRVGLLVPVSAPHMWHAAMQSKACKLTVLGEHYRRLVENNRI